MGLVHVGLDLEDKGGEIRGEHVHLTLVRHTGQRSGGHAQKLFQEGLHAEVGEGGAEEHRGQGAVSDGLHVKLPAGAQQLYLLLESGGPFFADELCYRRVIEVHLGGLGLFSVALAREEKDAALFQGVYDREKGRILFFEAEGRGRKASVTEVALEDPALEELIGASKAAALREEVELLGAGREFDLEAVRSGTLSPVFFGSALTNFGVEPFLEEFLRMTTAPLPRISDQGEVDVFSPDFSAFVFKIQANMNKAHRDRLAFMRICSGKFQRETEYFHVQSGKKLRLSQPQQMMAAEREIVEEAYAGDIIGVFDPGLFSIGDTITVPGKKFRFSGIPTFEPEHFMTVSPKDTMKRKQFIKGTEQIAQEGGIQIFKIPYTGMEEVIVGCVGTLQFDVFQYRLKNEYKVDLVMDNLPYEYLRWVDAFDGNLDDDLVIGNGQDIKLVEDYQGSKLLLFSAPWSIKWVQDKNKSLRLSEFGGAKF